MSALLDVLRALVGIVLPLLVPSLLSAWAKKVARGRSEAWRRAAWLPWIGLAISLLGFAVGMATLAYSFATIGSVDAASRATALARGISMGMNVSALGMALALLSYGASFALSLYATLRPPPPAASSADPDRFPP